MPIMDAAVDSSPDVRTGKRGFAGGQWAEFKRGGRSFRAMGGVKHIFLCV